MYDSFDNTYQATIGIDFLSKVYPSSQDHCDYYYPLKVTVRLIAMLFI